MRLALGESYKFVTLQCSHWRPELLNIFKVFIVDQIGELTKQHIFNSVRMRFYMSLVYFTIQVKFWDVCL